MATDALKMMEKQLISCVQGQLGDIKNADTHELGEAIDLIKDLTETIYYCTITDSMEKAEKKEDPQVNNITYYTTPVADNKMMYPNEYRNMERNNGYMYYPGGWNGGSMSGNNSSSGGSNTSGGSRSYYTQIPYDMMRDPRQGRSPMRRRMYMEGKEQHKDTNSQLKELEAYLQQLSTDITEMIRDASPEERATLHQKMTTLANKIV